LTLISSNVAVPVMLIIPSGQSQFAHAPDLLDRP
jgi:hypothetical protein